MKLSIHWCPELGLWTCDNGQTKRLVLPADIAPGAPLAGVAELFDAAKRAVETGQAALGIHAEV